MLRACVSMGVLACIVSPALSQPYKLTSASLTARTPEMDARTAALVKAWERYPAEQKADSLAHYLSSCYDPSDGLVSAYAARLTRTVLRRLPEGADRVLADSVTEGHLSTFVLGDTSAHARGEYLLRSAYLQLELGHRQRGYRLMDSLINVPEFSPVTKYSVLSNKEWVAQEQQDFALAHRLAEERLALCEKHSVLAGQVFVVHSSIANTYIEQDRHADALPHVRESVARIEALRSDTVAYYESFVIIAYLNYAEVSQRTGHAADAKTGMARAWALAERSGSEQNLAYCNVIAMRAALYDGRLDEAEAYYDKLAPFYVDMPTNAVSQYVEKNLIDLRVAQGRYEEAFRLHKTYAHVQDSLTRARLANDARAEARASTLRAELSGKELALAQSARDKAEAEVRTLSLVGAFGLALLGAGLAILFARRRQVHAKALQRQVAARTRELQEKTYRLEDSNRELERFAYIASHDLKTPLRNVTSFLNLIDRRLPAGARPAVGEYVEIATGYARQMHELVTDVLEFSRVDADLAAAAEPVDLAALAIRVGTAAAGARGEDARVHVRGAGTTHAPPAELERVLGNLISNGLKYNEAVRPTVEVDIMPPSSDDDGLLEVRVRDNGIGIAPEYHARVFELFKRLHTSDRYAGTGLGLAVVKKIVERLGGSVSLQSAEGEGSTFVLRLRHVDVKAGLVRV